MKGLTSAELRPRLDRKLQLRGSAQQANVGTRKVWKMTGRAIIVSNKLESEASLAFEELSA